MKKIFLLVFGVMVFNLTLKSQVSLSSGISLSLTQDYKYNSVYHSQISYGLNKYLGVFTGFCIDAASREDYFLKHNYNYTLYVYKINKIAYLGISFSPIHIKKHKLELEIAGVYEKSDREPNFSLTNLDSKDPEKYIIYLYDNNHSAGFGKMFGIQYSYSISKNISIGANFRIFNVEYLSIYSGLTVGITMYREKNIKDFIK